MAALSQRDAGFNPNHDPDNGQFTSGNGGGSSGSVAPIEALPVPEPVDHSPKAEPVAKLATQDRQDAELYQPILDGGDHMAAGAVSSDIMKRLGLTAKQIAKEK